MPMELLDPDDAAARADYERAFYTAFQRVPHNRLIRSLWLWDDEAGRLATRVPYSDQLVYLRRAEGAIDGALAVNVRLAEFQSAAYGFPPPSERGGACELLVFFSVSDRRVATTLGFWGACLADLHARGFHIAYTTARLDAYKVYLRFGPTLLDETEIGGERRYFLAFDTARGESKR